MWYCLRSYKIKIREVTFKITGYSVCVFKHTIGRTKFLLTIFYILSLTCQHGVVTVYFILNVSTQGGFNSNQRIWSDKKQEITVNLKEHFGLYSSHLFREPITHFLVFSKCGHFKQLNYNNFASISFLTYSLT